jgi:DNA-binding GntR family transcriptional regulator
MNLPNFKKEFTPQLPPSLTTQVTDFLTHAITRGDLTGGQRLVENELQRRFGVSRAPIRESFRILEKNGLVVTIPREGTYVRKITQRDVEENFPIRAYLEGLASRLALPNLKSEDIEGMESALTKMNEAAEESDFTSYVKHHRDFHEIFIAASGNRTLIGVLENLRRQALWFRFSHFYVQVNYEYAIRIHREILDLFIDNKQPDRLEKLIKDHIMAALEGFLRFLASKGE